MVYIARAMRQRVAETAQYRCGYCLTPQRLSGAQMHIEHIIPLSQGGASHADNLWLACAWCNSFKGTLERATDPQTGETVPLFNPRTQVWREHFRWSDDGAEIIGLTSVGRATVVTLHMNNEFIVAARRQWGVAGWHPPEN